MVLRSLVVLTGLGCAAPERAFEIRDSFPEADATEVAVTEEVVLELKRRVDASEAKVFWTTFGASRRIPARLEVEGRRRLRIVPLDTPVRGAIQDIRVLGLRSGDVSGQVQLQYRTLRNPTVSRSSEIFTDFFCLLDDEGRREVCKSDLDDLTLVDPGDDRIYTADEVPFENGRVFRYTYDDDLLAWVDQGRLDGGAFPTDSCTEFRYGPRENLVYAASALASDDRTCRTNDDELFHLEEWDLDERGFEALYARRRPGFDSKVGNENDFVDYFRYETDAAGANRSITSYTSFGDDGMWFTEDDGAKFRDNITYDALGRRTEIVRTDVGRDGQIGTGDDPILAITRFAYQDDGRLAASWEERPDRDLESAWRYTRENGLVVREEQLRDPGPDGEWLTADDGAPSEYREISYDDDGQMLVEWANVERGPDGVAFTEDDEVRTVLAFGP